MQQAPQPGRQCGLGSEGGLAAMAHPEGRRASFTRRHSLGSPHQTSAHKMGFHDARLSSGHISHVRISQMRAQPGRIGFDVAKRGSRIPAREPRFRKARFRRPDFARPDAVERRPSSARTCPYRAARRGLECFDAPRDPGVPALRFLKRASGRYSRRGHDDGAQGNEGGTMQETRRAAQATPAAPREDAALRTMRR